MERRSSSTRRPRVVSIPVHFVQSEQNQSASALKIQKECRGFLVRKSMKQIETIMKEVVEVERRIEVVNEVGRIVEKERLRLYETLMSLLLKLDSVRGICDGVRDCRRRVIKKAIALQEKVDSFSSATAASEIASVEDRVAVEEVKVGSMVAVSEFEPDPEEAAVEEEMKRIVLADADASDSVYDQVQFDVDEEKKTTSLPEEEIAADEGQVVAEEEKKRIEMEVADSVENVHSDQVKMEEEEEPKTIHCLMEDDGALPECDDCCSMNTEEDMDVKKEEGDEDRERKRSRDYLLEKMVEENEKLVVMMKELNEKNEIQMRLLNSLAQRVEMLEKTLVCDKLARMKKKKRHGPNNKF